MKKILKKDFSKIYKEEDYNRQLEGIINIRNNAINKSRIKTNILTISQIFNVDNGEEKEEKIIEDEIGPSHKFLRVKLKY